jgi:hypothetical protein
MVAHRAYGRGLVETSNERTNLLYFAAAVPTVGFVNRATDLNPTNTAALEGYAETRFIKRAQGSDRAPQTSGRWFLGQRWLP